MSLADRWFRWICILLLALLAGTQVIVALGDSQTWDEGTHLAAGYSYWRTGDYRLNPDHPALVRCCIRCRCCCWIQSFPRIIRPGRKCRTFSSARDS